MWHAHPARGPQFVFVPDFVDRPSCRFV